MNLVRRFFLLFLLFLSAIFVVLIWSSRSRDRDFSEVDVLRLQNELNRLQRMLKDEDDEIMVLRRRLEEVNKAKAKKPDVVSKPRGLWSKPIAVVVFVCSRADALREQLQKLLKYRTDPAAFPIIISQDCDSNEVATVASEFASQVEYVKHESSVHAHLKIPQRHQAYRTYYQIARHYKLGLDYVFKKRNFDSVIIVEDDLNISPDFFLYFSGTRYLLDEDPTLFCVSAWNDNGKANLINMDAADLLYRSDFFPGLGWMMIKSLWDELAQNWPTGFWDDWVRDPARRKGRQCIRPEVSRTAMTDFGKRGASNGLFFNFYLKRIVLNNQTVDFPNRDLSYLLPNNYKTKFLEMVYSLPAVTVQDFLLNTAKSGEFRAEYKTMNEYTDMVRMLKIMGDTKAGVPRTAYEGVVSVFIRGKRLYVAPADRDKWTGYDPQWEAPADILSPVDKNDI